MGQRRLHLAGQHEMNVAAALDAGLQIAQVEQAERQQFDSGEHGHARPAGERGEIAPDQRGDDARRRDGLQQPGQLQCLGENIARGDANYLSLLDEADAYVARNGLDLPPEPEARKFEPDPQCVKDPILELDLAEAGIGSIIWATGFTVDYGWLEADVFDEKGKPKHQRGVSAEPGIYFLGLPWQSRRGSSFIWGVWHDAKHVADHIATQRRYLEYHAAAKSETRVA